MNYKLNRNFHVDVGLEVSYKEVLAAVENLNAFLCTLPSNLYRSIDFKTTGAMIGGIFCTELVAQIPHSTINPIEKGHPDIIPLSAINSPEAVLRNYPVGLEIKGTIGNLETGVNLRAGQMRIHNLTGITWQAHHREVNHLMGIVWDFVNNPIDNFYFPAITGVFFSNSLCTDDWGAISGTTGRNTKVTGMCHSGKRKMGHGWVLIYDSPDYVVKYTRLLGIPSIGKV